MLSPENYDLVVIGSGPAGEKAALHAAYFGKRVAVVEQAPVPGGNPARRTGVPTKTLRETAQYLTSFRHRDVYGVSLSLDAQVTVERLASRTAEVIRTVTDAARENLERAGAWLVHGVVRLAKDHTVLVDGEGFELALYGEVILIATGSRPRRPAAIPFHYPKVVDSEGVLELEHIPTSMVVVGGGAVGCEYASIFTALGTNVTLLESSERLLSFMDAEISQRFAEVLGDHGTQVMLGAEVAAIHQGSGGPQVTLSTGQTLSSEYVLFAGGREGNTRDLGLEEVGIFTTDDGYVVVDEHFRTTARAIYAAGDVIGAPGQASVAAEQGRLVASHAFRLGVRDQMDSLPPYSVYAIPEVAMIGLTEEQVRLQGVDYEVGRGAFDANPRAVIAGGMEGMVKLVFRRSDRILLGVHILGDIASELVHIGQAVIRQHLPIDYFIETTFNVPTFTDAYKAAAYDGLIRLDQRSKV